MLETGLYIGNISVKELKKQKAMLEERLKACKTPEEIADCKALLNAARTLIELKTRPVK